MCTCTELPCGGSCVLNSPRGLHTCCAPGSSIAVTCILGLFVVTSCGTACVGLWHATHRQGCNKLVGSVAPPLLNGQHALGFALSLSEPCWSHTSSVVTCLLLAVSGFIELLAGVRRCRVVNRAGLWTPGYTCNV